MNESTESRESDLLRQRRANFEELVRLYQGQIVVLYNGALVAHGHDPHRLRLDAARKLNVSPDCLTVELVYAPEL